MTIFLTLNFEIQSAFKMNKSNTIQISARLWLFTWLTLSVGAFVMSLSAPLPASLIFVLYLLYSSLGSLPLLPTLYFSLKEISKTNYPISKKIAFVLSIQLVFCLGYGFLLNYINGNIFETSALYEIFFVTIILFACSCISFVLSRNMLQQYFSPTYNLIHKIDIDSPNEINELDDFST